MHGGPHLELSHDEQDALSALHQRAVQTAYEQLAAEKVSWQFGGLIIATALLLCVVPLIPGADVVLGDLRAHHTLPTGVVLALAFVPTWWSHRRYGALHIVHRVAEAGGAIVWLWGMLALIFLSGSVASVFWLVAMAVVFGNTRNVLNGQIYTLAQVLGVGALALAFVADGDGASAVLTLVLSVCLLAPHHTLLASERARLMLVAEVELLGRRLRAKDVQLERERFARDLHDGLGAELSALVLLADSIEADDDPTRAGAAVVERARLTLVELRQIIWALKRGEQSAAAFFELLRDRCTALIPPGIHTTFERTGPGDVALVPDVQEALLRGAQELCRNAVQHANATSIAVRLDVDEAASIEVADNGTGLSAETLALSESGLANLQTRATTLGGHLSLLPSAAGATLRLGVPRTAAHLGGGRTGRSQGAGAGVAAPAS